MPPVKGGGTEIRMNRILIMLFLFFIGSIIGWIIELFFRRYFSPGGRKYKKWVNPGFLTGPYLPLYGFGLCALYILANFGVDGIVTNRMLGMLITFIVMAVAMTAIEFVAGLIFIKGMNIKLWDYSNEWMNIKGIICPLFSFFWGLFGTVYCLLIHPHVLDALEWLAANLAFSFVIGFFYGIFVIDLCYSFNIAVRIKNFAAEKDIIVKLEELKQHLISGREVRKEKKRFVFSLSSTIPLSDIFELSYEKFSIFKKHKRKF